MNNRQRLVQQQFLNNEEAVIKRLKQVYGQSYNDITKKVADLDESIAYLQEVYKGIEPDGLTGAALDYFASRGQDPSPEQAQETVKSMLQSKVYQKNYQTALQKQVDGILDKMHTNEFKTVSDYLKTCYDDGFIGAMFDLQGQGIPLCFPLDQEAMVRAVQLDSKISQGLYSRMGEDVAMLKKHITAQVSRGVANGMSYEKIAQQIGFKMLGTYDTPGGAYANALRIARTEGHRIQVQGTMDACYKAKEKGADVVKQWDSTLDSATRESHQKVDGEIRELDEKFSNGLMFPGDPSGGASEVVNCRCALLQRSRKGLDEAELETLKERAKYFGLDKSDSFEDYKKKYLNATEELTKSVNYDSIISGAISGARNPFSAEAKEHAEKYYGLVRSMKTDVSKISKTTGISKKDVQTIKDFIFNEKHDLGGPELEYFEPDYMMAESWQRLIAGKPEPHDITLLKHELMEKKLMSKGLTQEEAHIETSKKYNYSKEAGEYYAKVEKYKTK